MSQMTKLETRIQDLEEENKVIHHFNATELTKRIQSVMQKDIHEITNRSLSNSMEST